MAKFTIFENVKMNDDREGRTYTGIKLRPVNDRDGYYVESLENVHKRAFLTEETYQKILSNENVTIHI